MVRLGAHVLVGPVEGGRPLQDANFRLHLLATTSRFVSLLSYTTGMAGILLFARSLLEFGVACPCFKGHSASTKAPTGIPNIYYESIPASFATNMPPIGFRIYSYKNALGSQKLAIMTRRLFLTRAVDGLFS